MENFFSKFKNSAHELTEVRTLTTTGMFLALAIVLRFFALQLTEDLRITFTFIPIFVIAILYGPVVCGMSTFALDLIGYIIDSKSARGYSPQLALVVILSGVIYGAILYKKEFKRLFETIINCFFARLSVVLFCNTILNSYFIYSLYVNKNFSIFALQDNDWNAFFIWIAPRVIKNTVLLPIEVFALVLIIPLLMKAYRQVVKKPLKIGQ